MMRRIFQDAIALIAALLIVISSLPFPVSANDSIPSETLPEETVPVETIPQETASEEAVPEASDPEETGPEETVAEETAPPETAPEHPVPTETVPEEIPVPMTLRKEPEVSGPGFFFGLLHSHSSISDGTSAPDDLFRSAAEKENMDFFAVTDLSDSIDCTNEADIQTDATALSADWTEGKSAAADATSPNFVGIYGYEMGWPDRMDLGHISTFATPGFQTPLQDDYLHADTALQNYYDAISSVSASVSQFNHPLVGRVNFQDFAYDADADRVLSLMEVDLNADDPLRFYIEALDAGWHLAPTAAQSINSSSWQDNGIRTAVYAETLTEEGILEALRLCQAYATQDPDLQIRYSMDGHFMGSRLDHRHVGDTMDLSVSVRDATDGNACLVEVITVGGETAGSRQTSDGNVNFSIPTASGYWFLKITQPDGHIAVTAPIWADAEEDLGITGLTCETQVPVQGEPTRLKLDLQNGESTDFTVSSLEILAEGTVIFSDTTLKTIPRQSTLSHSIIFSCDTPGLTTVTVHLTVLLEGKLRCFEASLDISFHQASQVTTVLADGSHGNAGTDQLTILSQLAETRNIRFTATSVTPSARMLKNCRFLLVSAPSVPFSQHFIQTVADYAAQGGSIVLCGQAEDPFGVAELNRLLSAVGSTIRFHADAAEDHVHNGGDPRLLYPDEINTALSCCGDVTADQVFCFDRGCTIDPGNGSWLLRGFSTTHSSLDSQTSPVTLMAREALTVGGAVYAAGCPFLSDLYLEKPESLWGSPYANRTLALNLLGIGGDTTVLSAIKEAKACPDGTLVRISGHVTAGTSNPHNAFRNTIYVQDQTGGIAVIPFSGHSVQPGTPVEIVGYITTQNGNRAIRLADWRRSPGSMYFPPAKTGSWNSLLDIRANGGTLVEIEGKCLEIYCREDGTMAGCLLVDETGSKAIIRIEDNIRNGSDGKNELHLTICKGRTVRAMGILYTDEYGDTILRVRNCEEVVWVPPGTYFNPKTGDPIFLPAGMTAVSLMGLLLLKKRKTA